MSNFIKVWVCQRLGLGEISGTVAFPRYLSWPLVRMQNERIKKCFEVNQVHYSCICNCKRRTANLYTVIC